MKRALATLGALVLTTLAAGCGDGQQAAVTQPSASASALPSPCPAPALTPGYLPSSVEPVTEDPIYGMPERLRTWKRDGVLVQLAEGIVGDHGDEPRLKQVTVRGDEFGHMLSLSDDLDGQRISVDWVEETRCGHKQYIVVTRGLSEDETLKIAQKLEGSTT